MEHVTHCDQCDSTFKAENYLKIPKRKSGKERAKEVAVCGTLENAIMELTGRRRPPTGPLLTLPPPLPLTNVPLWTSNGIVNYRTDTVSHSALQCVVCCTILL